MSTNRIVAEPPPVRLPRPPAAEASPASFMLLPLSALPAMSVELWLCQQQVYLWAYEQAQAVVQPSIVERDLLGVWN